MGAQKTMKTRRGLYAFIAALALFLGGLAHANAALVYDNGPILGSNGWSIGYYSVSDSFTISTSSTLTSAQIGLWAINGGSPTALHWSIGTTLGGSDVSSGTVNLATNTYLGLGYGQWSVYQSSFPISGAVNAGTYYFTLDNATSSPASNVFWDISNGPSTGFLFADQYPGGGHSVGSESFQLYGTPVPEPSGVSLLLLAGCGLLLRHARKN
jgi:hypothetical protein